MKGGPTIRIRQDCSVRTERFSRSAASCSLRRVSGSCGKFGDISSVHHLRCNETAYDRVREIDAAINQVRRLRMRRFPPGAACVRPPLSPGVCGCLYSGSIKLTLTTLFGPLLHCLSKSLFC